MMKRILGKILALLCLAVTAIALSHMLAPAPQLSSFEYSAVISGDSATVHLMPSRFTHTVGICLPGQRLSVKKPSLFDFYRARCNNIGGWISSSQIVVTD